MTPLLRRVASTQQRCAFVLPILVALCCVNTWNAVTATREVCVPGLHIGEEPLCSNARCAAVAVHELGPALAHHFRSSRLPLTAPLTCISHDAIAGGTCACEMRYFDLIEAQREIRSGKYRLVGVGDSTTFLLMGWLHWLAEANVSRLAEIQHVLDLGAPFPTQLTDIFAATRALANSSWISTPMLSKYGRVLLNVNDYACAAKVPSARNATVGLSIVNHGLHILWTNFQLPYTADHYRTYERLVLGHLLSHLASSSNCSVPHFVTWRESNPICRRTNYERQNVYYKFAQNISALRYALGVAEWTERSTMTAVELQQLQSVIDRKAYGHEFATAVHEQVLSLKGSLAPLMASYDSFGSRSLNRKASRAHRLAQTYLARRDPVGSFNDFCRDSNTCVVDFLPATERDKSWKSLNGLFGKFGGDEPVRAFTVNEQRAAAHWWTSTRFAHAAPAQRNAALARLLPIYRVEELGDVMCRLTDNDARHYHGGLSTEGRTVLQTLRFLAASTTE